MGIRKAVTSLSVTSLSNQALAHPYITLAITVVLVYFAVLFLPAFVLGIREGVTNRTIEKTKTAAVEEKTAATQDKISAGQIETERKAEDLNREQTLTPQRQQASATLAEATRRRQQAEDLYEKNRNARRIPDPNDLNLRQRNCSELAEIYPDQRFSGCK